jgi:hypothetical protein
LGPGDTATKILDVTSEVLQSEDDEARPESGQGVLFLAHSELPTNEKKLDGRV